jgi:flagellar basal-body rod protein FlgF
MLRSLYTSTLSLLSHNKSMDVIANNLANANTTGYKKDNVVYESFPDVLTSRLNDYDSSTNPTSKIGDMHLGSDVGEIRTNFTQGQIVHTKNPFDLCIDNADNSFFSIGVKNENGDLEEYYSRDGSFALDKNNMLITNTGDYVLGNDDEPIFIDNSNFSVNSSGQIILGESNIINSLKITTFKDSSTLQKLGSNLVKKTDASEITEFKGSIRQGALESSNVNSVKEMVNMISIMRSYEANQKIVQMIDSTLEKSVNEVGRPG